MKLTQKQYEFLTVIDEATVWKGSVRPGLELARYFVPSRKPSYSPTLKEDFHCYGSGDASIFRSLAKSGLVRMIPLINRYACAITEEGMLALAKYREANHV